MATKQFRPMKGDSIEVSHDTPDDDVIKILSTLSFPRMASPKLDGIRALVRGGQLVSSSLKLIPNNYVREYFEHLEGRDGELLLNQPSMKMIYRNTDSAVMTEHGTPDIRFWAFDLHDRPDWGYEKRYGLLKDRCAGSDRDVLRHEIIKTPTAMLDYEKFMLSLDYEGVMMRSFDGLYKYGRSTLKEGHLLKIKRFRQEEAEIIDFVEKRTNTNEQKKDERGLAKRSSHKAGKIPAGTLGAFVVRSAKFPKPFEIGSGLTAAEAKAVWDDRKSYKGKLVTFKFFDIGDYAVPRHPVFIGFRDRRNL